MNAFGAVFLSSSLLDAGVWAELAVVKKHAMTDNRIVNRSAIFILLAPLKFELRLFLISA
jgi:hypothetical protein